MRMCMLRAWRIWGPGPGSRVPDPRPRIPMHGMNTPSAAAACAAAADDERAEHRSSRHSYAVMICTQLVVIPASYTPVSWCCNIVPRSMHPNNNTISCTLPACYDVPCFL